MNNKRIFFLRSGYDDTSDPRMEKEIYSLYQAGYKVKVIAWDRSKNVDSIIKINIKGINIKFYMVDIKGEYGLGMSATLKGMIAFNRRLLGLLIKYHESYDFIHACDFDTVLPAYITAKKYKKKLIYDIFDYYADSHFMPDAVASVIRKVDTFIINHVDAVILCNEERINQIKPANPKKIAIVHNTPDINIDEIVKDVKHSGDEDNQISIVYVGRLESTGRFLKEIVDILSEDKRFILHIGGGGPLQDYITRKSKDSKNIVFYGSMKYADVIKLENRCDVMTAIYDPILKNHRYAAPNKFYEALMLGKPLIVMENTGIDKTVADAHIGWVIKQSENF
ncbi:MAG: glycosyltransferase, partial [Oribacterium sp.]|nr:glycosyltransferase [Oribacterium sp.]